jgi:hypothetical protein
VHDAPHLSDVGLRALPGRLLLGLDPSRERGSVQHHGGQQGRQHGEHGTTIALRRAAAATLPEHHHAEHGSQQVQHADQRQE